MVFPPLTEEENFEKESKMTLTANSHSDYYSLKEISYGLSVKKP